MTPQESSQSQLWVIRSRAQALMDIGRWNEAVALLHQALGVSPNDAGILCRLSLSYLNLGDTYSALQYADRAVAAAPDNEWGHRLRSIVLAKDGRAREAVEAAREAARLAPMEPKALLTLSQALRASGQLREAQATAEHLREIAPEWEQTHQELGLIALKRKRPKEAEEHCRRALAIDPGSYYSMNNLGVALLRQGRKKEAVDCFHRAAKLKPSERLARANLKEAVDKFLPRITTGYGLWVLYNLIRLSSGDRQAQDSGTILLIIVPLLALSFYLWRRHRLNQLPEEVRFYVRVERAKRVRWNFNPKIFLALSGIVLALWLFLWATDGSGSSRPSTIMGWSIFVTVVAVFLVCLYLQFRQRIAAFFRSDSEI